MELKEFVTLALVQIVNGVREANQELLGESKAASDAKNPFLLAYSGGEDPDTPHVEFDLAVTTETDSKAAGGASATLHVVAFGLGGSKSTINQSVSRVRFSVTVNEHLG